MCHSNQKQIITRYLTNNPKLAAGIELKKITQPFVKPMRVILPLTLMSDIPHGLLSSRKGQQTLQPEDGIIPINGFAQRTGV
jgi:hypothetical protein